MASSLDPHTAYMNPGEFNDLLASMTGEFGGLGIEVNKPGKRAPVVVLGVFEDTPAERAGVKMGDIIVEIDGQSISRYSDTREVVEKLRGKPGTVANFTVMREGVKEPLSFKVVRDVIRVAQVKSELIRTEKYVFGVIHSRHFHVKHAMEIKAHIEKMEKVGGAKLSGIILRLDGNPGGYLDEAIAVADLFTDSPSFVLQRTNNGITLVPDNTRKIEQKTPGDILRGLPLLVVVDPRSASASEIVARWLQHSGRATIACISWGQALDESCTFGKGTIQTVKTLLTSDLVTKVQNYSAIKFTTAEYLVGTLDNWVPVQCVGIIPDVLIDYPGAKPPKRTIECELDGMINSGGPMPNAPPRVSLKDKDPISYQRTLEMVNAFKPYLTEKHKEIEARLMLIEKSSKQK
jgi:carboxyl-terminal processing protease